MDQEIARLCQERLEYTFRAVALLEQAMTHCSVAPTRLQSNERMEFLGDAVLGLVVVDELYRSREDLLEGEMTKIKSAVVSRRTCSQIANDLGLCEFVNLGKGMGEYCDLPQSVPAALLEAVIGAIYLDGGLEAATPFILRHIRPYIDEMDENQHGLNYKSRLQQHVQRRWALTPEYHMLDEKGPDHSKCFEVAVSIDGRHFSSAWGMNKKDAEQKAARNALRELGVEEIPDEAAVELQDDE